MCAQFGVQINASQLEDLTKVKVPANFEFPQRILPQQLAPVIVSDELRTMVFSLTPSWSKTERVKFATHNARLESESEGRNIKIFDKPTWRTPFRKFHCLIPMSGFFEAIHEGTYAGNMVEFRSENHPLLLAAGIFDTWKDPSSGRLRESFAILTDSPSDFVRNSGHDRQPLFLKPSLARQWTNPTSQMKDEDWIHFLRQSIEDHKWSVRIERKLAGSRRPKSNS